MVRKVEEQSPDDFLIEVRKGDLETLSRLCINLGNEGFSTQEINQISRRLLLTYGELGYWGRENLSPLYLQEVILPFTSGMFVSSLLSLSQSVQEADYLLDQANMMQTRLVTDSICLPEIEKLEQASFSLLESFISVRDEMNKRADTLALLSHTDLEKEMAYLVLQQTVLEQLLTDILRLELKRE